MLIFSKIDQLKKEYISDCRIRKNGTVLLGSDKDLPLYARHTLFKPLTQDLIDEYLINNYKYHIPDQYIAFLKYSNGMSLFTAKRKFAGFKIASSIFTIFGIPLTPPFVRSQEMEEPFDIRIEDLGRHDDIAENWLKCGSYKKGSNLYVTYDIFIDTTTNRVYSCIKNDNKIVSEWNDFDLCLCDLFDDLKSTKIEY
jgi:hypothetical protein